MVPIALIAAMDRDRIIGRDNQMPWYVPEDLRHFKQLTLGKPVVMGRKTFESIGKPLPGRDNIVVSARSDYRPKAVQVAHDLDTALRLAQASAARSGAEEVMVIGGGNLYAQTLARATRLYLTLIDLQVGGDTRFPEWDWQDWQITERADHPASQNTPGFSFTTLIKKQTAPGG